MIVILCNSHEGALKAFNYFLYFLDVYYPSCIREIYDACYCVETDDDLRYIFVDWRLAPVFADMTPDLIEVNRFFEDWEIFCGERGNQNKDILEYFRKED